MSARTDAVATVARALFLHYLDEVVDPDTSWAAIQESAREEPTAREAFTELMGDAEAVIAALETNMGLHLELGLNYQGQSEPDSWINPADSMRSDLTEADGSHARLVTNWQETDHG